MLAPLKKEGWVHNYLDDVILYAPDCDTLAARIDKLFSRLTEACAKLNLSKCHFGQRSVKYLGHVISEQGCQPHPKNVEAVVNMKPPKNLKEVRRFLGLTGFYRKFILAYAQLALPLTNFQRKMQNLIGTRRTPSYSYFSKSHSG